MRVPGRLEPLMDQGVIDEVLRPLMSGKEAEVFLVTSYGEECVAKVYKNAEFRSFQNRAEYIEGRRVRNSREQRAMDKGSRHGRLKTEDAWRSAEADAIFQLHAAGVRVPKPYDFIEGVLVMELVKDEHGEPAPRLVDRRFSAEEANEVFQVVLREVVKMLCAGIVHADLSDFNILMGTEGPVLIDFPQAVDPAHNQNARRLLLRDLTNLSSFLGRYAPNLRRTQYGPEMWDLYERSELKPDTELTGRFKSRQQKADVGSMLDEILEMEREAKERRERLGLPPPRRARRPTPAPEPEPEPRPARSSRGKKPNRKPGVEPGFRDQSQQAAAPTTAPKKRRRRRGKPAGSGEGQQPRSEAKAAAPRPPPRPAPGAAPAGDGQAPPRRRRRRRRRRRGGGGSSGSAGSSSTNS
jgi:RIO kinase 1